MANLLFNRSTGESPFERGVTPLAEDEDEDEEPMLLMLAERVRPWVATRGPNPVRWIPRVDAVVVELTG